MNERIEKLVIEAFFDESTNGADQKMYTLGEEKMQKFAELIVKECAKVLTQHGAYFSGDGEPYHYAAHLIEEHFGVEE